MERPFAITIMLAALMGTAAAQPQHDHAVMMRDAVIAAPREMGQSAFAAIQEIVAMLEADSSTDWSRVNIDALRDHLADMDNVVLHASIVSTVGDGAITFNLSGDGPVQESIRRMVFAQAATAHGEPGWNYSATMTERGAAITIATGDTTTLAKLKALGYFGIVSQGPHHQVHHLAIARGQSPH